MTAAALILGIVVTAGIGLYVVWAAAIRRWILLAVVALIGLGAMVPPLHAEDEQTITVQAGGQMVLADFTTTAAETFTTVTSVSLWDGEAWSLVYRPSTGTTDFPIKPGSWLWIVSPGAQTITIAAPPPPPGPIPGGGPEVTAGSCAFVDGAAHVAASTAQVLTPYGTGTAFYIGDDEWMTAAHVVAEGGRIRLGTETRELAATVIGRDDAADLALLRASGAGFTPLEFADYAALRLGETLGAAGYPILVTGSPSVSDGLLSKFVTYDGIAYIQTSAEISPGNSGGPLFTTCGTIVGVNVWKVALLETEGVGFAVTIPTIEERLPRLRAGHIDAAPSTAAPSTVVPSVFGITAFCNEFWDARAGVYVPYGTAEACHAAGINGVDPLKQWNIWGDGFLRWEDLYFWISGGDWFWEWEDRDEMFLSLAPGQYWLYIIDKEDAHANGADATVSDPYSFTIKGVGESIGKPEIIAFCNPGVPDSAADCRARSAEGLHAGAGWGWRMWATVDVWDNAVFRIDGGSAVSYGDFWEAVGKLPPGLHTVAVREQHPWGWTEWSSPYSFTLIGRKPQITAICNTPWDDAAGAYAPYAKAEECHAAGLGGVAFVGERWRWWGRNFDEWEDLQLGIDGGTVFNYSDRAWHFRRLGPGQHYVHIRERLANGEWTDWGAPYYFTVKILLRVAICDSGPDSFWECWTDGRDGIRRGAWGITAWGNVLDYDQARYSVNGGEATTGDTMRAIVRNLPSGQHTIRVGEFRSWGWTGWSPPFTFTIH